MPNTKIKIGQNSALTMPPALNNNQTGGSLERLVSNTLLLISPP